MKILPVTALLLAAPALPLLSVRAGQDQDGEDLVRRLVTRAERAAEEQTLDGLVVVVGVGDDVLLERGWGRLPGGARATPSSPVRAATLVEPLAVVAALQLVEDGKVDLEAPIGTYLEGVEWDGAEVTVHHLLSQTSGLIGWTRAWEAAGGASVDTMGLIDLVKEVGVQTSPGSCFEYSESNGLLVGALVEAVTERSLAEVIEEDVLAPAKLSATGFDVAGAPPAQEEAGCSTEIGGEQVDVLHGVHAFSEDDFCASARDLFDLRRALVGGAVLESGTADAMAESKRLADGHETGYGYGVSVARLGDFTGSVTGGSADGTTVHVAYYPAPDLTVVVLVAEERASLTALERDLARIVLGLPLPGVQDLAVDADEAAAFEGTYQVGCTSFIVRLGEDGRLRVAVADRPEYRLLYQGRRRFVAARDTDVVFEFVVDRDEEEAHKMIIDERGRVSEAVRFQ